jgi:(2Fe-2S) ferredoxin
MSAPYECHLFICTNRRPDGHPRGSCAAKGSEEVRARFKSEIDKRGLRDTVRANAAGCLDVCEHGVSVVVYPEGTWYGRVTVDDVATIVEQHVVGGKPVERLRMPLDGDRDE